ncbi:condensin subunit Smc [Sulfurivirga caldicuralii]|uniref:Chromosome partition protein Smc n=1 Tax=Sulfurivirga caldicuralii TaxID=364032 RepID=A0A1N6FEK9_9GAMM|nr:AAA family ATPase [Sulfurivirga caldicuralii]SIN93718.1 condensin subunit Smc [Sulfurivirga caldicuralii]
MRLKYIKLAGFKSFAEPTRLDFPGNIVCIVGPNGCGKSNTLDAIRWVMGESAAKELRGGELNDVLFNGTDRRKPVSQCSVELVFDNSDHGLKGPWNRYEALSVKRVHHREQGSHFLLNQQRCRRRDIQALFDGTGLGPRSYALIGQGSINRIIESRPEQLRQMLEELAGIGHYRQRRRETLNRLEATRENLAQLTIQLTTWQEQAEALAAQCETARRHQQLSEALENLTRTVFRGRYAKLMQRLQQDEAALQAQQAAFVRAQQAVETVEKDLVLKQQQLPQVSEAVANARAQWHRLDKACDLTQAQAAQWERRKEQLTQQRTELMQRLQTLEARRSALEAQLDEMEAVRAQLNREKAALAPEQAALKERVRMLTEAVQAAERDERQLHWQLDGIKQRLRTAQAEHERLQREQARLQQQRDALQQRLTSLTAPPETAPLEEAVAQQEATIEAQAYEIERLQDTLERLRGQLSYQEAAVLEKRDAVQRSEAELAGLQAVQASLLEDGGEAETSVGKPLVELVHVTDPAWQQAVERWLGNRLVKGRIVEAWSEHLPDAPWVGIDAPAVLIDDGVPRLHQILQAPWPILRQAQFVRLTEKEGVPDFLESLAEHESVLSPAGVLYRRFERILPVAGSGEGALARQRRIETLQSELDTLRPKLSDAEETLQHLQAERAEMEQALRAAHQAREATQRGLQQVQKQLLQAREAEARYQQQRVELNRQLADIVQQLDKLAPQLLEVNEQCQQLEAEKAGLQAQWREAETAALQQRQHLRTVRQQLEALTSKQAALMQREQQLAVDEARLSAERDQLQTRAHEINGMLEQAAADLEQLLQTSPPSVDEAFQARDKARTLLAQAESELQAAQKQVEALHQQRHEAEQARNRVEQTLAKLEVAIAQAQQQLQALAQSAQEEAGLSPAQLRQLALQEPVDLADAERQLKQVKRELAQLGPVNMTAVSAWETLQKKIEDLQAQKADVEAAVEQLEASIRTIDRDSRKRLRETWREARTRFQAMFPRMFRGGEADLVWVDPDADPLEGGLLVMARPPGKRNTRIQMLSGGEKTLTALALIFAFFEMQPAPFCVLDEVDAPLDDANVLRFCELVKGMAKRLQFILITHNKTTMQMAEQLLGVTMNEPGVSRVVSVDLDAAMEMIGEEAS